VIRTYLSPIIDVLLKQLSQEIIKIAAQQYSDKISVNLRKRFDLVLLSLGEDGHIASLFPGRDKGNDEQVIAVVNAPKNPQNRVSLTILALTNCHNLVAMAIGKEKRTVLKGWLSGVKLSVTSSQSSFWNRFVYQSR